MVLIVFFCASAVALSAVPATASACASLRKVKSFHGHASASIVALTSGSDPESGGTETIGFGRVAQQLAINLTEKVKGHGIVDFTGSATGGKLSVDDTFENSGADIAGEAKYDHPLPKNRGAVDLLLNRKTCEYKFELGFIVKPTFDGDAEVNPGNLGENVSSQAKGIAGDLSLHGFAASGAYPECSDPLLAAGACAGIESGWMGDFIDLFECGSLDTSACTLSNEPEIGHASFSWDLKPRFVKRAKK